MPPAAENNNPTRGESASNVATGSGGARAPTRALLYTATTDNPNFFLSSSLEEAADTIASAVGPSGPNSDYLFSLSEYLQKVSLSGAEKGRFCM